MVYLQPYANGLLVINQIRKSIYCTFMFSEALKKAKANLVSWERGLENPGEAQEKILESFLDDYSKTEYGSKYYSEDVEAFARALQGKT